MRECRKGFRVKSSELLSRKILFALLGSLLTRPSDHYEQTVTTNIDTESKRY
jgi:hypothetical protein